MESKREFNMITPCFYIILLVMMNMIALNAHAISYNFNGHIDSIDIHGGEQGWSPQLGITVGDAFSGSFSFDENNPYEAYYSGNAYYTYTEIKINNFNFSGNGTIITGTDYDQATTQTIAILNDTPDIAGLFGNTSDALDKHELYVSFLDINMYAYNSLSDGTMVDYIAIHGAVEPIAPVPEPSTILLLGLGISGLAVWRRKKNTVLD